MLRAYLFLALLESKTLPKQRKILSRNKYTVIGIPITVYLFLDRILRCFGSVLDSKSARNK